MTDFINNILIRNFKSLGECELTSLKRINLIIGRPGSGKTNLFEALSLSSLPFITRHHYDFRRLFRETSAEDMFHHGRSEAGAQVSCDRFDCILSGAADHLTITAICEKANGVDFQCHIDDSFRVAPSENGGLMRPPITPYSYQGSFIDSQESRNQLAWPTGRNLLHVLKSNEKIRRLVNDVLQENYLGLTVEGPLWFYRQFEEQRIPVTFTMLGASMQRLIYYLVAVASNSEAVLLFETPESQIFPGVLGPLTRQIAGSRTNQFLITTHSPVLLADFLRFCRSDLVVFVLTNVDYQTQVRRLDDNQLMDIVNFGIDIFTNNELFTP